jgi:tetratricopeptide (TPR) repeat protein
LWYFRGRAYQARYRTDLAVADYTQALERGGDGPGLRRERGLQSLALRRHEQAAADLTEALKGRPDDAAALQGRGQALLQLGRTRPAADDFLRAVALRPRDAALLAGILGEYVASDRRVDAATFLDRAVEAQPDSSPLWLERGRAHAALARWDRAAASHARALELDPAADAAAWYEQAALRLLNGDPDGYRRSCAHLLEDFEWGRAGPSAALVARACALAPDADADPRVLEPLLSPPPASPRVPGLDKPRLAALHFRAGRFGEAVPLLREHLKGPVVRDDDVAVWLWLALALHRQGQDEEAKTWLGKATAWLDRQEKGLPTQPRQVILQPVPPPGQPPPPVAPAPAVGVMPPLPLHDWLEAHVLRREAESLLGKAKP